MKMLIMPPFKEVQEMKMLIMPPFKRHQVEIVSIWIEWYLNVISTWLIISVGWDRLFIDLVSLVGRDVISKTLHYLVDLVKYSEKTLRKFMDQVQKSGHGSKVGKSSWRSWILEVKVSGCGMSDVGMRIDSYQSHGPRLRFIGLSSGS